MVFSTNYQRIKSKYDIVSDQKRVIALRYNQILLNRNY